MESHRKEQKKLMADLSGAKRRQSSEGLKQVEVYKLYKCLITLLYI